MPKTALTHKSIRRFAVLSGMRRVGKTTILYQIIDHLIDEGVNSGNILYATFDNPILKLVNVENVLSIYEAIYPTTGTRYVLFDEVQYTENWELWMKVIYDSRKDIRLIATGSASPVLEKRSADSVQAGGVFLKSLLCPFMNIADCLIWIYRACRIIYAYPGLKL